MKFLICLFMPLAALSQNTTNIYPVYNGDDLGVRYNPEQTDFKVWAPGADSVTVSIFSNGEDSLPRRQIALKKIENGAWYGPATGNLKNFYYTFSVRRGNRVSIPLPDIYARAVGVNGLRGMIVDLPATDPPGWKADKKPPLKNATDIVIYEAHIRDISVAKNSGISNKGKFAGLCEKGTKNTTGEATGLDHLKQLGITHIHLLPVFDFNSVNEANPAAQYNWGYDPVNYNVPEGSYSSDAADGNTRITEFKKLVLALHKAGIRVIMDVVYNHTANTQSGFNQFAPGYFYRQNANGGYSDATGCGNETASEQPMMRKFMIESVLYWAKEYHVDGFRFDLMGVHDIETMNRLSDSLHALDPTIFIYGEGWTAGTSSYPENLRAVKANTPKLRGIAAFSDDIRDALHGPYSDVKQKGFVSGATGNAESIRFGITGSTQHPQINYAAVHYSKAPWANEPSQCINYVSCHDDNCLWDRLVIDNPGASESDLVKMDLLSQAVVLTSQGVPFILAGEEMLRTKKGVANSFNSPDSINELDWSRKTKYKNVFNYYCALISLRRNHPAFRMPAAAMIRKHLAFIETNDPLLVAYQLNDHANFDKWQTILVYINGDAKGKTIVLPPGEWTMIANAGTINENGLGKYSGIVSIPGICESIFYR